MSAKKLSLKITFILVFSLIFTSFTGHAAPSEKGPIRIGLLLPMTGMLIAAGVGRYEGMKLAFDQLPLQVAGRKVEFILEDEASDPSKTMDKVRKLIESDKVCMTIGIVHSGSMQGVAGYYDRMKVPHISVAQHPDNIVLNHSWVWLTLGTLEQSTYPGGAFAYEQLGAKTLATFAPDYVAGRDYIKGFVRAFEERGGKVVQQQWFPPGTTDFTPFIVKVAKADLLAYWATGPSSVAFNNQWKELGAKTPRFAVVTDEYNPKIAPEIGDAAEGLYGRITASPILGYPEDKQFVDAFIKKYGKTPEHGNAIGYAVVQLALEVLKKTGGNTSSDALAKALIEVTPETVIGRIVHNTNRIAITNEAIVKYTKRGGKISAQMVKVYEVRADKVGDKLVVKLAK